MTVTVTTGAFDGLKYVATVAADTVKTTDGKFVEKYTSAVTNATDSAAPVVTSTQKLNSSVVRVHFSEPLSSAGNWSYSFADGSTAAVIANTSTLSEGYVDLTIGGGVTAGQEITATIIGAKDYAGNLINPNPVKVNFSKGAADGVKPTVTALNVLGLNKFEVKFSEEVQGFNGTDITIDGGAALADITAGTAGTLEAGEASVVRDATDKTKYTVTLGTGLTAGVHTVGILAGVTDLSGETNAAYSKVVEFKADEAAPALTSSQVKKDANGLEFLHLTFNEAVSANTITALNATQVKDFVTATGTIDLSGLTPVSGTGNKEYKVQLSTVQFDANGVSAPTAAALVSGATYSVTLTGGFTDGANALGTSSISFNRGTDALTVAQTVASAVQTTGKPSEVKVTFNQDVDGASATNKGNYSISGVVVENAEIRAGEANAVYLTLQSGSNALTGDRSITINGVKTKDGVAMSSADTRIITLEENVKPTFTAALVSADTIKVTFSENVKDAVDGITIADFAVKYDGNALTETGVTPQFAGVYTTATGTTAITSSDTVSEVYIKLASGVVADLSKTITVGTEGTSVKDAKLNTWAAGTVTVSK